MNNRDIAEFIIYTINKIADMTGRSTANVYRILSETGCIDAYLVPCYDVLHTMGPQSVAEDVLRYISLRGKTL